MNWKNLVIKLTTVIDNHLNKMKLTNRDMLMINEVEQTKKFIKLNKYMFVLKAGKPKKL